MQNFRLPLDRRTIYRHAKRTLYNLLLKEWTDSRAALDRLVRAFLRGRERTYLLRLVRRQAFAVAVVATVLASATAQATSLIEISEIESGTGGFALFGNNAEDRTGTGVSGIGDMNDDGFADIIVGAYTADPDGKSSAGEAYVVFGKADGTAIELSTVGSATDGFAIYGIDAEDLAGFSVSGAGDVNGDGISDLIVSAHNASPDGRTHAGEIYVVFGKADNAAVELSSVALGIGGFIIKGVDWSDSAGLSVSGAGDVNGDGLADLIVGARSANPNGNNSGQAYVVFGKEDTTAVELSAIVSGVGGFAINGRLTSDSLGGSVSSAGDVNGDGLCDIIVGEFNSGAGKSIVVFGKVDGAVVETSAVGTEIGGFIIHGISFGDSAGFGVSGAGDVNGDGLADLLVGAHMADPHGFRSAGESYVVFGKEDWTDVYLSDVAAGIGGFIINGLSEKDYTGRRVSGVGDINGDGLADVLIGQSFAGIGGASYVVFGKADGKKVELSKIVAGIGGFAIGAGASVSGAGDVNGDGLADLIIGASSSSPDGKPQAGSAYVVFSPESAPISAVYMGRSRAGDGVGGDLVLPTVLEDARLTIDFSDDDFGSNSLETVTLLRSNSTLTNFPGNAAGVGWCVSTDRRGWTNAELTVKSVDAERSALTLPESALALFTAPFLSGPWTKRVTMVDQGRNEWSYETGGTFSTVFLALGELTTVWADFAFGGTGTGEQTTPYNTFQEALDNVVDGGTLKIKGDTGVPSIPETLTISKPITIKAVNGTVILGGP